MSKRAVEMVTMILRAARLVATGAMCWSALVLAATMLAWPEAAGAQGIGELVAVAKTTEEIANTLPTDVTRLALQVAVVSMLVNAVLIFAFYKVVARFGTKPCIMSGEPGQAIVSSWCARAYDRGVERAERELQGAARK